MSVNLYDHCASCTYMGTSSDYEGKYNCELKWGRVFATDSRCGRYTKAYSRSDSSMANMYNNSLSHQQGSGCYITTITCDILGLPDNNMYLNTLRALRDNYMQKHEEHQQTLLSYDIVGPIIALKLNQDPNRKVIATTCFEKYIKKAVEEVQLENYEGAISIYKDMTTSLATYYDVEEKMHTEINIGNIDKKYLGHGKIRRLVPQKNNY